MLKNYIFTCKDLLINSLSAKLNGKILLKDHGI